MNGFNIIGFTFEDTKQIETETNIRFDFDMGILCPYVIEDGDRNYDISEDKLIQYVEDKFQIKIPRDKMRLIVSDGDQSLDYYLGMDWAIIYKEE